MGEGWDHSMAQDRYYTGWEAWLPELWKVMGLPQMPLSQARVLVVGSAGGGFQLHHDG